MNWTGRICSHMFCTHVTNVSKASGQCGCVGKKTTKVNNYFIILHFVLWKDLVLLTILSPCPSSMFGRPLITWDGPAPPSDAISMCFFLFTAFSSDSEREMVSGWICRDGRWEQNPSSPFLCSSSQNNNYTPALLPMKYTEQLTGLQIGLTNICIVLITTTSWLVETRFFRRRDTWTETWNIIQFVQG